MKTVRVVAVGFDDGDELALTHECVRIGNHPVGYTLTYDSDKRAENEFIYGGTAFPCTLYPASSTCWHIPDIR